MAPCGSERSGKLRPAIKRVRPFPSLDLSERLDHVHAVLAGELAAPFSLSVQS